ncbi:MAG: DoxX family protein [Chitinophagaceae bacterium]|nr:DoxX family protein [Chitinophagaceae bacterium]
MSFFNLSAGQSGNWKGYEKIILRFFILYFILLAVPLDWKFYRHLFSTFSNGFNFYDLFILSKYMPVFFSLEGFGSWIVAAIIAAIGSAAWPYFERRAINYDTLYYWLRVILRYRLAAGVIAYGLIKIFPMQMPYPSLSNLHTNYGDFFPWKIYYHTLAVAPGYEVFLGLVEVIAGVLLINRRTVTFGSGILIGYTGNVFAANIAYDGAELAYSAYLFLIAVFLFAYDAPRLYNLLVLRKYATASKFRPVFSERGIRNIRFALKSVFSLFILLLGAATYANFANAPYKLPATPGLKGSYGFYNVREFRLNNRIIPYSTTDPNRWQNVVFEKWATISIKIAKPLRLDASSGEGYYEADIDRNFESSGVGGRRYYSFSADTTANTLLLKNKNKHHAKETFQLQFSRPNDSTIIVKGVNEKNDSIYAVMDKITRKYMLIEGRRKPVKL